MDILTNELKAPDKEDGQMKFAILDSFMDSTIEREICKGNDFICYEARSEVDLPDDIEELDGCMVWHYINITKETLNRLKKCKAIVRIGVGYDSVDIKAAGERGIVVCNVPDYGTNDVADHAMALMLAASRSINAYDEALHKDVSLGWHPEIGGKIHRLTNSEMGIIGMGRIGHAVAMRAKAFGMNVTFFDPYLPDGYDKSYGIKRADSIEELFENADYVSIHTPLTEETKGFVNSKCFEAAKKPFVLINTARGGIVKLDDVYVALKEGKIRKFAADVLEEEPPCKDNVLIKAVLEDEDGLGKRVILTPHSAFYAVESRIEMREKAAKTLVCLAKGIPLRNCVNREFLINPRAKISEV